MKRVAVWPVDLILIRPSPPSEVERKRLAQEMVKNALGASPSSTADVALGEGYALVEALMAILGSPPDAPWTPEDERLVERGRKWLDRLKGQEFVFVATASSNLVRARTDPKEDAL